MPRGPEAVRFFYDERHVRSGGALPEPVGITLETEPLKNWVRWALPVASTKDCPYQARTFVPPVYSKTRSIKKRKEQLTRIVFKRVFKCFYKQPSQAL